jgi:hypothetical protein
MTGPPGASSPEVIATTRDSAAAGIPHPQRPPDEREAGPARPGNRHLRLCTRCGGAGTHYLTCPSLRLPADRHAGQEPVPQRLGSLVPDRSVG